MFIRHEKSVKEYYSKYPITATLLAVITGVMILTFIIDARFGEWTFSMYTGITPDMMERGEYWKLLTNALVHAGLAHFIANGSFLLLMGPPLEVMLGKRRFAAMLLITALTCSLSVFYLGSQNAVGASGICFGMMGIYLYLILFRKGLLDPQSTKIIMYWLLAGWVTSFVLPNISISGHFGGFVGGILFSLVTVRKNARLRMWQE